MAKVSITKLKNNEYRLSCGEITAIYSFNGIQNKIEFLSHNIKELWNNPKMCEVYKVASELSRNVCRS